MANPKQELIKRIAFRALPASKLIPGPVDDLALAGGALVAYGLADPRVRGAVGNVAQGYGQFSRNLPGGFMSVGDATRDKLASQIAQNKMESVITEPPEIDIPSPPDVWNPPSPTDITDTDEQNEYGISYEQEPLIGGPRKPNRPKLVPPPIGEISKTEDKDAIADRVLRERLAKAKGKNLSELEEDPKAPEEIGFGRSPISPTKIPYRQANAVTDWAESQEMLEKGVYRGKKGTVRQWSNYPEDVMSSTAEKAPISEFYTHAKWERPVFKGALKDVGIKDMHPAIKEKLSDPILSGRLIEVAQGKFKDTQYGRNVKRDIIIRNDLYHSMDGTVSPTLLPQSIAKQLNGKGLEGLWQYRQKQGVLANPSKPEIAVSSSLLNCEPSEICARGCYAAEGNCGMVNSITANAINDILVNADPVRFAKMVLEEWATAKSTGSKRYEGEQPDYLRFLDRGESNENMRKVFDYLSDHGVKIQAFTKIPELYKGVGDQHIVNVSIDRSNFDKLKGRIYKNQQAAVNWTGQKDNEMAEYFYRRGQLGLILPWEGQEGAGDIKKAVESIPKNLRGYVCPINSKGRMMDEKEGKGWRCTDCGKNAVGCAWNKNKASRPNVGVMKPLDKYDIEQKRLRVSQAEDQYRLPNLKKVIPPHKQNDLIKSTPDEVTIYRSAPIDSGGIRPGDWVGIDRKYVMAMVGKGKIFSMKVPASDVVWAGTDENEFFYAPKAMKNKAS